MPVGAKLLSPLSAPPAPDSNVPYSGDEEKKTGVFRLREEEVE
jgi:hypothetical protein